MGIIKAWANSLAVHDPERSDVDALALVVEAVAYDLREAEAAGLAVDTNAYVNLGYLEGLHKIALGYEVLRASKEQPES